MPAATGKSLAKQRVASVLKLTAAILASATAIPCALGLAIQLFS